MYNEKIKREFMEQLDHLGEVRYNTIFSYVEELENSYNADIFPQKLFCPDILCMEEACGQWNRIL